MNIRTLCLGILQFADATGYEINKLVADGRFSHFIEASYGSIYPALTRMMQEELVTCQTQVQAGRPSRKIYAITPAGREELFEALKEKPQPNRFKSEFLFLCLFAGSIPSNHLKQAIDAHEKQLGDVIKDMQEHMECCSESGSRFSLGYGLAAKQATLAYVKENKERLLNAKPSKQETTPDAVAIKAENKEKSDE